MVREDNRAFSTPNFTSVSIQWNKGFFFYHHRITEDTNISSLRSHLSEFLSLYNIKDRKCKVVLFYQNIVDKSVEKFIDFSLPETGLLEFVCHTHDIWGGDDLETFWAKKDDELFVSMLSKVDEMNKRDLMKYH
ncbi:hypothetical protein DP187_21280 [Enterobacter cloacae]|nr:hypothetical protein DP187_21280 [Enterobacter cloacae]